MKKRNMFRSLICILVSSMILFSCTGKKEEPETLVKTVALGERKMDYFRFGNEEGKKVVILPGVALKSVMGSAEAVVGAYALLAKDYDVYLFDHVKVEPENYDIRQMAEDTYEALKKIGLEKVSFMGVSLGGMIAQVIALDHPESVESLVLCSASSNVKSGDTSVLKSWRKLAQEKDIDGLMASFGENIYSPSFYEQYKDAIIASGQGASELDYTNFIISLDAILAFDVHERLQEIECPTFVIGAGKDKVLGRQASIDMAEILGCRYYIYEDSYHAVYDEAPDYLERIKGFLDETFYGPDIIEDARVSYLGPEGTYTEEAAQFFFDESETYIPESSVDLAIQDVIEGKADYAVIPQENTLGGAVVNYVDALIKTDDIYVVGEVIIPISQTLMGLPGTALEDIKTVCSHVQGITQSEKWRKQYLPDVEIREMDSTAAAARFVAQSDDKSIAAIAAPGAARLYGLEVLAENVQISDANRTRFYVLSKNILQSGKKRNAVFLATCEGSLIDDIIVKIHESGLEIVSIHDRPEGSGLGIYNYIIEVENSDGIDEGALDEIISIPEIRYFGSFTVKEK